MSKNIIELSDNTFKDEVEKGEGPVLVDFWAPWCAPCSAVAPVLEKIAEAFSGKLKVCKLNIDDNQEATSRLGVMSIPTLIIFKDGEEVERIVGALGEEELTRRIKEKIG